MRAPVPVLLTVIVIVGLASVAALQNESRIAGRVTDAATGGALEGARVHAFELRSRTHREAVTDQRGTYLLERVPAGRYVLSAVAAGYANERILRAAGADAPPYLVEVGRSEALIGLDVALSRAATVSGRVTDPSGAAIDDVEMSVEGSVAPIGLGAAKAMTDRSGAYTISGVPPGPQVLVARYHVSPGSRGSPPRTVYFPGVRARTDATPVVLTAGDHTRRLDIVLPVERRFEVRGMISGGAGGLNESTARLVGNRGRSIRTMQLNTSDGFVFDDVSEGIYLLWVEQPRGRDEGMLAAWRAIEVSSDLNLGPVTLEPAGRLTGRIHGAPGGPSPGGLLVETVVVAGGETFQLIQDRPAVVDAGGHFELDGVLGRRRLLVRGLTLGWSVRLSRANPDAEGHIDVEIQSAGDVNLELAIVSTAVR